MPCFEIVIHVGLTIEAANKEEAETQVKDYMNRLLVANQKENETLTDVSIVTDAPNNAFAGDFDGAGEDGGVTERPDVASFRA